jgi:hypothetical protein
MFDHMKAETGTSCRLATSVLVAVLAAVCSGAGTASASTQTFTNPAPIAIPASATSGTASPYPSSVVVNGMPGAITDVNVTLHRFGHTAPLDVDIRLGLAERRQRDRHVGRL